MPPEDKPTSTSGANSSSGSTSSGSSGGAQTEDTSQAARKPQDAPPASATATTDNSSGNSSAASADANKEKSRSLGDEEPEAQKTPEELRAEQIEAALKETIARFNITNPTVVANLEKEFSTPGVKLTNEFVEKQVQNTDPVNFAMTKFREMTGGQMVNIANVQQMQLSPQSVGMSQQQGRGAGVFT